MENINSCASTVNISIDRGRHILFFRKNVFDTYWMEFSMRVIVRKAARLAVYEDMTMRANIHQTPIIILVARVV